MNFMTFHMLGIVTPTDCHIFQRGWNHQPDTIGLSPNIIGYQDFPSGGTGLSSRDHGCSPHGRVLKAPIFTQNISGGFLSHRATPSHPAIRWGFSHGNHPSSDFIGVAHLWKPTCGMGMRASCASTWVKGNGLSWWMVMRLGQWPETCLMKLVEECWRYMEVS